jgi:hypothetical protein
MITLDRVKYCINDTIECNKKYHIIDLFGGEPTLHPQFKEIVLLFEKANKEHNITDMLTVGTNGYAQESFNLCHFAEQHGFITENSLKDEGFKNHTKKWEYIPSNVAPCDVGHEVPKDGCWYYKAGHGGFAFDNKGYYACNLILASARLFDYQPACQSVKDLTEEKVKEGFEQHCKRCPLALPIDPLFLGKQVSSARDDIIDIVTECPTKRVIRQTMSKSYVEAIAKYQEKMKKTEEEQRFEDGY